MSDYIYEEIIVGAHKNGDVEIPGSPIIKREEINTENIMWIPKDPANSDYQRYLAWLAEQDEVTE